MFNLTINENMKIYRRLRTWLLVLGMSVLIILVGALYHHNQTSHASQNWKQQLIKQDVQLKKNMKSKSISKPDLQRLQVEYKTNQYHINHNISPSHISGWDFANTIVQRLGILISVFVAVIAGDIVASEFSWGTIKALLTRPFKRWQILLSKFISTLIFGAFFSAFTFLASYIVGGIFFGFGGAGQAQIYVNGHQAITQVSTGTYTLMNYGFMGIELFMTVTIAFMISAIFRSSSLAISLSIVTLFVGSTVVHFLQGYSWDKYILFANVDLSQYFINGPSISGMTLGFSIITLIVYFLLMTGLSYVIFGKRDVSID